MEIAHAERFPNSGPIAAFNSLHHRFAPAKGEQATRFLFELDPHGWRSRGFDDPFARQTDTGSERFEIRLRHATPVGSAHAGKHRSRKRLSARAPQVISGSAGAASGQAEFRQPTDKVAAFLFT